jgi:hypothetical protein
MSGNCRLVPAGLGSISGAIPRTNVLGYYLPPLRGYELRGHPIAALEALRHPKSCERWVSGIAPFGFAQGRLWGTPVRGVGNSRFLTGLSARFGMTEVLRGLRHD